MALNLKLLFSCPKTQRAAQPGIVIVIIRERVKSLDDPRPDQLGDAFCVASNPRLIKHRSQNMSFESLRHRQGGAAPGYGRSSRSVRTGRSVLAVVLSPEREETQIFGSEAPSWRLKPSASLS